MDDRAATLLQQTMRSDEIILAEKWLMAVIRREDEFLFFIHYFMHYLVRLREKMGLSRALFGAHSRYTNQEDGSILGNISNDGFTG